MLGDKIKVSTVSDFTENFNCEELAKMIVRARKEKLKYKEMYEFEKSMHEITLQSEDNMNNQLIEKANRCDELEKENKHKTEMVHLLMDSVGLRYKSHYVHELTDKLNQLKQDALLGKAIKLMYGCGYLMEKQGHCMFNTRGVLDWYKQQLEKGK